MTPYEHWLARRKAAANEWKETDPQPNRHDFDDILDYMRERNGWLERLSEFGREWDASNPSAIA